MGKIRQMKVLLDTNILIDYISLRPSFTDDAMNVMELCMNKQIDGYIAAHSVTNAFYILRKELTAVERRKALTNLCDILTVVGVDKEKLTAALNNDDFSDFEDCLQNECAKEFSADYIITRNVKDFHNSAIPAILPDEFLKKI